MIRSFKVKSALVASAALLVLASCGSDESSGTKAPPDPGQSDTSVADASSDTPAATDCPPVEGTGTQEQQFDEAPPMCLEDGATYQAVVTTNKGEFTIELDPASAPVAANNFVFLARNEYFDDTLCHRIIPNFVVQCGDPTATGTGGPGYTIVDEPPTVPYEIGSVAMAKTSAPDSGGSQFFIITGSEGAALPPEYALFGKVTEGLDTAVAAMAAAGTAAGTPSEPIEIQSIRIVQS